MWIERPGYLIGRYMNEVSGVHARVVQQCNELDEVWVPSKHHIEVFAKAGVDRSKLAVIPEIIDPGIFDPSTIEPMLLPPGRKKYMSFLVSLNLKRGRIGGNFSHAGAIISGGKRNCD